MRWTQLRSALKLKSKVWRSRRGMMRRDITLALALKLALLAVLFALFSGPANRPASDAAATAAAVTGATREWSA